MITRLCLWTVVVKLATQVRPASPTAHLHDPWKNGKDTYRHIVLSVTTSHAIPIWPRVWSLCGEGEPDLLHSGQVTC